MRTSKLTKPTPINSFAKSARKHLQSKEALKVSLSKTIPLRKLLFTSLIVSLLTIGLVLALQRYLPPEVPLLYGLPLGEEQITSSTSLIIPSLISVAVFVINASIIFVLEDKYIQQLLVMTTFAVTLLSSITTLKIIFLISSF